MRDIAKRGLKGRKKDTFLLKLVITLAFIFIVASTIFQGSIDKTKLEQRLDLYGEWHAAYLKADEETVEKLKREPEVDKVGASLIIGESDNCGVVGTFNEDLMDMGRFSLYKGRYPEAPNEIMLELNQMSNMNLDLEVGQKINIAITIPTVDADPKEYMMNRNKELYERTLELYPEVDDYFKEYDRLWDLHYEALSRGEDTSEIESAMSALYWNMMFFRPKYHEHHETPFEQMGDVAVVSSNDYFYYYMEGDKVNPDIIREDGILLNQKVILKKEFIVTGIIKTYTDKWDLGGHNSPNAFITEEGGKTFTDAFYGTEIVDFSDYEMYYNAFLYSDSAKEELYNKLKPHYLNVEDSTSKEKEHVEYDVWFWMDMFGKTDEEIEYILEEATIVSGRSLLEARVNAGEIDRISQPWRDDSLEGVGDLANKIEINTDNFRRNIFSYPETTTSTEYVLALAIIAVVFIVTALAIFQIFLTQMKRRSRKIVLLKSIGSTNGQIIKMLIYEGLYLLRTGLLIGVPAGFGIAALVIYGMNVFGGRNLQLYIVPNLLILGIVAGCLALFIGMAVPMIFAIRIPLVGTMLKPPKHKKIKRKDSRNNEIKCQTFGYINWRYFKLNKGKTLISFGISFATITIMLMTALLCYFSFDNYKTAVLAKNRPDYAMELFYGETSRGLSQAKEELMKIEGIEQADVYKVGRQTFLWYDGIEDNKLFQTYKQLLPKGILPGHFSSYNPDLEGQPEWISNAFYTKIYGIDPDSELFTRYSLTVIDGNVDKEKFDKGEEIILLTPMYLQGYVDIEEKHFDERQVIETTNENNRMSWLFEQSGAYKLTYSSRYKDYYNKQNDIKPGDTIYISADAEKIAGESYVISHNTKEVTVGGVIHYFPKEGMWPFSNNLSPYVIIGSMKCMESIYPNSKLGLYPNTLEQMRTMVDYIYPNGYGRTLWHINTDTREQDPVLDSKLLAYANNNGYTLYNYKDSSSQLYYEAFNNAIIIGLLGFTAAVIAFIILYNTMVSKMEQDRNRIGILQSLGVTKNQFSKHYIKVGILSGLLSILIVNILLITVLFITSVGMAKGVSMTFEEYIKDIFEYRFWLYPWAVHIAICAVFFVLTIIIYYFPSKKVISLYPVENIRSLGR